KLILLLIFIISLTYILNATTYNTPVIDATISISTNDWDADEYMGPAAGEPTWELYLTWDETYLYIGSYGPDWRPSGNDEVNIYFDTQSGGNSTGLHGDENLGMDADFAIRLDNKDQANRTGYYYYITGWNWNAFDGTNDFFENDKKTDKFEIRIRWSTITNGKSSSPVPFNLLVANADNQGNYTAAWPADNTQYGSGIINYYWSESGGEGISPQNAPTLPVILSILTAQYVNNQAQLYWRTQSETDNIGWNVYRNNESYYASSEQVNTTLIDGYGTTTEPHDYTYTDPSVQLIGGTTYYYWLESLDLSGKSDIHGPVEMHINPGNEPGNNQAGEEEHDGLYDLSNNPFNPALGQEAEISFQLKSSAKVKLDVFNVKGQLIKNLYTGKASNENCTWNGTDLNGNLQKSGVYLYRLLVNGKVYDTQKIILFR
ncbi:MAG: T9SS type A sorting domain-containing protein, partial [Candidatus Cloacimonetes bacterium]|nr:T9SS type A sorting domain-containing protein [Candidatus Cloacimonadota bacterium]